MSTHKHIDKICCVVIVLAIALTLIFMNGKSFGIQEAASVKGYETRLFDTGSVHTIDIIMDDWDSFLETCTNEEYTLCSVVIDNEAYKNVAIRAKGNTSLTQVASYGNDRYSFKIEFDHYDSTKSYYGLDKLSLNNIIQDNTYMKDYLTYSMMGYFGVDAPLCSFVYITVNGEDWGLYLAVEGVEEAFLERNYGNDYGELYKPDSQSMGGGRGNGGNFEIEDWQSEAENNGKQETDGTDDETQNQLPDSSVRPQKPGGFGSFSQENPDDMQIPQMPEENTNSGGFSQGMNPFGSEMPQTPDENSDSGDFSQDITPPDFQSSQPPNENNGFTGGMGGKPDNMGGSMGSSDVSLIYTDDEYSSYLNIFDNAKTDITDDDKDRFISSLKQLNEMDNIEQVVNIDEVTRYFVVHNFVCNFDSYTGSMIHNYYIYEENGQFYMIPWDYNLAFGGFQGSQDATALVNYPIDTPVSGGTVDSRPMLAWIFSSEEYTDLYHQYFEEFITSYFDSGYFIEMIETVQEMISPYVEKDPTKFCTYEEFETGISTLKEFCLLRAESVSKQLDGTIPSDSDGQKEQSDTLVDASAINISDMGTMNNTMDNGMGMNGGFGFRPENSNRQSLNNIGGNDSQLTEDQSTLPDENQSENESDDFSIENNTQQTPDFTTKNRQQTGQMTDDNTFENSFSNFSNDSSTSASQNSGGWILLTISTAVLIAGILCAVLYKKQK